MPHLPTLTLTLPLETTPASKFWKSSDFLLYFVNLIDGMEPLAAKKSACLADRRRAIIQVVLGYERAFADLLAEKQKKLEEVNFIFEQKMQSILKSDSVTSSHIKKERFSSPQLIENVEHCPPPFSKEELPPRIKPQRDDSENKMFSSHQFAENDDDSLPPYILVKEEFSQRIKAERDESETLTETSIHFSPTESNSDIESKSASASAAAEHDSDYCPSESQGYSSENERMCFVCNFCLKSYSTKYSLKRHKARHQFSV